MPPIPARSASQQRRKNSTTFAAIGSIRRTSFASSRKSRRATPTAFCRRTRTPPKNSRSARSQISIISARNGSPMRTKRSTARSPPPMAGPRLFQPKPPWKNSSPSISRVARGSKVELAPPARSAPKNPLPSPLRQLDDGLEGFVAGLFHQAQIRLAKTDGQERRTAFFGQAGERGIKNIEMRAGHGSKRGEDFRRGVAHGKIVAARPMCLQNLDRDKKLAARAMPRKCPNRPGDPIGNPRMSGGLAARGSLRSVEDERGKPQKIRACRLCIGFERRDGIHRLPIKGVPPRDNQFEERRFRQIEARDRIEQGGGDGIGLGLGHIGRPFERVPPPLEADLAKQGLGDDFVHAGDFETESIEGVDVPPRL